MEVPFRPNALDSASAPEAGHQQTESEAEQLETSTVPEKAAAHEVVEYPETLRINLSHFNATRMARLTIAGDEPPAAEIYLIASKNFENESGYFKYDIQAFEGTSPAEGGAGMQNADNKVKLGLFGSINRLKTFVDENPEIRRVARQLGGNIEPVNQQYGYGFMICKYPEHESRPEEFII